ncbi:hypothetical protein B0H13DRAFT_2456196 [Mycena leptocephala]|nr:hypothetical protein B0H13DRAFT_2456196 [Mycena leptocephala]
MTKREEKENRTNSPPRPSPRPFRPPALGRGARVGRRWRRRRSRCSLLWVDLPSPPSFSPSFSPTAVQLESEEEQESESNLDRRKTKSAHAIDTLLSAMHSSLPPPAAHGAVPAYDAPPPALGLAPDASASPSAAAIVGDAGRLVPILPALKWDSSGISVYFSSAGRYPETLTQGRRSPIRGGCRWLTGPPRIATRGSTFTRTSRFLIRRFVVIKLTGIRSRAGSAWTGSGTPGQAQSCATRTGYLTCEAFVQGSGASFADADWEVKSVKFYNTTTPL